MTRLALCLLLLATGASATELPSGVWSFEDKPRGVVCYVMNSLGNNAISCVKVWLPQVAGNQRQLSPHETKPNPNLHPLWRLGAGLMRGMSCDRDQHDTRAI